MKNILRQVRFERRETQSQLAVATGIARKTIYNIEYENHPPSRGVMTKLEAHYGQRIFFFDDEEAKK